MPAWNNENNDDGGDYDDVDDNDDNGDNDDDNDDDDGNGDHTKAQKLWCIHHSGAGPASHELEDRSFIHDNVLEYIYVQHALKFNKTCCLPCLTTHGSCMA